MKWFRLYTAVLHDSKVQRLHPSTFKHWINVLCIANGNQERGILPPVGDVAFTLRLKPAEAVKVLARLEQAGLLDRDEGGRLFPHNWTERQRDSDVVSTRVQRYREKKKREIKEVGENVTLHPRFSNALDLEVDTDDKKLLPAKNPPAGFRLFSDWFCHAFEKCQGYCRGRFLYEAGRTDGGNAAPLIAQEKPCEAQVLAWLFFCEIG